MRDESPAQPSIATSADTPPPAPRASTRDYGYYRRAFAGHAMPFAWLDLDLLDENIRAILGRAGSKNVRIASKSVRSVAVLRRILAASPVFRGLMCFTAREAAWLAGQGFDDLLLGYPVWHPDDLAAVARVTADGAHITLMVDSVAHVEQAESVARQHSVRLPLCLEVDMTLAVPGLHFGVWRSPLLNADLDRPVLERIARSGDVFLDGIMG
ncbi:MAG TPA: alanine racemase [Ktedonobacterales bacterium]|nr:alanine racemase [Ktedonobacterales bacterium]